MDKICQACGNKFHCLGTEECWCHEYKLSSKRLEELKLSSSDCYCEKCLLSKAKPDN